MELIEMSLSCLEAHPLNSNVMPRDLLLKLADHLARTGRYPPVIVRKLAEPAGTDGGRFQILDGHHRVEALRHIGSATARCVVWQVDDAEALTLLATLNRLQGQDDPHKRAALVAQLQRRQGVDLAELTRQLPEQAGQLRALMALNESPRVRPAREADTLPVAVHFFLKREQRDELEQKLREIGGAREEALMRLVAC